MVVLVPTFAIAPGYLGIAAALFALLLVFPAASVVIVSQLLRSIPDNLRGRVMSAVALTTGGLSAAGPITAGILIEQVGALSAVLIAAPALIGATLITCVPIVRDAVGYIDAVRPT
jgi:MFS family permease